MAIAKTSVTLLLVLAVAIVALLAFSAVPAAAAAPDVVGPGDGSVPFLCPSVGKGVANNADKKPTLGQLPTGDYTFLPGHNQAGAHANPMAFNTLSPGESPGPGNVPGPGHGNSDWSPIWPQANPVL